MLRLVAPGDAGAGVETGAAEGELDEPPQDGRRVVSTTATVVLSRIASNPPETNPDHVLPHGAIKGVRS